MQWRGRRVYYLPRRLEVALPNVSCKAIGNSSVTIADSGMSILAKKNAGLFSQFTPIFYLNEGKYTCHLSSWLSSCFLHG